MQVKTSGMFKQDFILKRLLDEKIEIRPNIRIQKNIIEYITELTPELKRLERVEQDSTVLDNIRYLFRIDTETVSGIKERLCQRGRAFLIDNELITVATEKVLSEHPT